MMIETERLELIPLPPRQLRFWVEDMPRLEKELSAEYRAEPLEGHFLNVVKRILAIVENDPPNYSWSSFWFMLRKSDRVIVGSADFKGVPDENGNVEIGYGLGKAFERNGYMTEAVRAMCDWAFQQGNVASVTAQTAPDNVASQNVLKRCGFTLCSQGEMFRWKREA